MKKRLEKELRLFQEDTGFELLTLKIEDGKYVLNRGEISKNFQQVLEKITEEKADSYIQKLKDFYLPMFKNGYGKTVTIHFVPDNFSEISLIDEGLMLEEFFLPREDEDLQQWAREHFSQTCRFDFEEIKIKQIFDPVGERKRLEKAISSKYFLKRSEYDRRVEILLEEKLQEFKEVVKSIQMEDEENE